MNKYLIVATQKELELPAAKQCIEKYGYTPIVTGVGGVNVICALRDLPHDAHVTNVGYVGSPDLPIGTVCIIGTVHSYHPGISFREKYFALTYDAEKRTRCYTAGDFIEGKVELPPNSVIDMELAYIAAFGFTKLVAVKYVSDNLDYNQYQESLQK